MKFQNESMFQRSTDEELNTNAKKLREACENYLIDGKSIKHGKNHRNCGQSFSDP